MSPGFDLGTSIGRAGLGARRVIMIATSGSRSSNEATVFAAQLAAVDLLVIGAPKRDRALLRKAPTRRWIQAHAPCQIVTAALRGEAAWF